MALVLSGCSQDIKADVPYYPGAQTLISDLEPLPMTQTSPSKYMKDVCHNNTLPYIKENIEAEGEKFDEFCSCMSDWSLKNIEGENLHAFALGYHRFNWGFFQRHYGGVSKDALAKVFVTDSRRHVKEYNINSADVYSGLNKAYVIYSTCSQSDVPWMYRGASAN